MVQEVENHQAEAEPQPLTMKGLLEAGTHFGHPTRRWHPKMKSYIFTQRNGIHIIDLQQTLTHIERACNFVTELVANGGVLLFIGTKKQAQEAVAAEAERCHMPYVNQRWLGGTLTNFQTIRTRINYMKELQTQFEEGKLGHLPRKEVLKLNEEMTRLKKHFTGVRELKALPDALFIVDLVKEQNAVAEARRTGIPIVALVDTDADPLQADHPIPGNDDAIRSVRLICSQIANACIEGRKRYEAMQAEAKVETEQAEAEGIKPEGEVVIEKFDLAQIEGIDLPADEDTDANT
jgi:small subunit ribosomal protein S2